MIKLLWIAALSVVAVLASAHEDAPMPAQHAGVVTEAASGNNAELSAAGALQTVQDAAALADALYALLTDSELAQARREAGLRVIAANQGAVARQLALLTPLLPPA